MQVLLLSLKRSFTDMRNTIIVVIFVTLFGSAAWYSLTQTLDDLTRRDCQAGVVKACEALAQSK
jgi:hypothetical protein